MTIAAYRRELVRFRGFSDRTGPNRSVREVDRRLVQNFQRSISRGGTERVANLRGLKQTTVQRRLVVLRGFLRYAHDKAWLTEDLVAQIQLSRVPDRPPSPMNEDHRALLIRSLTGSTLRDKRDKALILLLLSSGARISELLRLDRRDWTHNRLVLRDRGHRQRTALVTRRARAAVDDYLAARAKRGDVAAALFISCHRALANSGNNRLTAAGARHICIRLAQRANIPMFQLHELRDTLGCLVQQTCDDPRLTADTLGLVGLGSVAGYVSFAERTKRASARKAIQAVGL
jgi:site-specific recombinase XerD